MSDESNGHHTKTLPLPRERMHFAEMPPEHSMSLWWLVIVVLIALVAGVFLFVHFRKSAEAAKAQPAAAGAKGIPVVTAIAKKGDLPIYLTGLGSVSPLNTVTVRTRVDGQIEQIAFTEGTLVKKGQLLFQIDPRPFQVQLEQAEGQMAKDQANLKNAQLDLQRYTQLLKSQSVTQQQVDTQQALVNQDEGSIKSDQAQIDSAKLQLIYTRITSPIDGRIGLRLVDLGNIVHAADTTGLVVIAQLQPITVVFTLAEDFIPQVESAIARGKPLPVDAYDRAGRKKITTGTLLATDSQIDPASGTLRFKAQFSNENDALFPQQFVNTRLLVDELHDAVLVPAAAVQRSPDANFIYVVNKDKAASIRNVTLGPQEGDTIAISKGLSAGEVVVTDGVDKLQEGTHVIPHAAGEVGAATRPSTRPSQSLDAPATRPGE